MVKERLYIKDIQKVLQYRDRRSVRKWCRNNHVRILSDTGSNRRFVLRDEFEKSMNKNYHTGRGILHSSRNFFLSEHPVRPETETKYCPKGENEKRSLSIFTSL